MRRLTFLADLARARRLYRLLDRIAVAQEAQVVELRRLADQFCPSVPLPEDLATTGPSFARDHDQVLIQAFTDRFILDTGRLPTDDEIADYLDAQATR